MALSPQGRGRVAASSARSRDLTRDEGLGPGLLLPPQGDEHSDVPQPSVPEPVDCQLQALARKHLLVAMAVRKKAEKTETNIQKKETSSLMFPFILHARRHKAHTPHIPFQEVVSFTRHVLRVVQILQNKDCKSAEMRNTAAPG